LLQARHACTTAPKTGTLSWRLVSWSRSCDKTKTKTKAVKICLEATLRQATASRHHITSDPYKWCNMGIGAKDFGDSLCVILKSFCVYVVDIVGVLYIFLHCRDIVFLAVQQSCCLT